MGLGISSPEGGNSPQPDLELARHNIDLLELMQEKTQGNRTPEEDRLLDHLLFETRLKYVERQKDLARKK